MTRSDDIAAQLRTLVAQRLGTQETAVSGDASLTNDLGADSLALVGLIMEIEDEFHIDIPDEDAVHLGTVKELLHYVEFATAANDVGPPPSVTKLRAGRSNS